MAQRHMTVLVDDLDGSEGVETISYTWEGRGYEIDLNKENAERFRQAMNPWVEASRRVAKNSTGAPRRGGASRSAQQERTRKIRAWGKENGWEVSDRGRIPGDLEKAYDKANS